MSIFQVKSNLKHNGLLYKAGTCVELEAKDVIQAIRAKVLILVADAKTISEGEKLVRENVARIKEKIAEKKAVAPENTYGPKNDKDAADEKVKADAEAAEIAADVSKDEEKKADESAGGHKEQISGSGADANANDNDNADIL